MQQPVHPWNVALVSGDAAGRLGLEALLGALRPEVSLRASVAAPSPFWRLPRELLWSLDELLVHPESLDGGVDAGLLFIAQVQCMLPRLCIRALGTLPACAGLKTHAGVKVVNYGAGLRTLTISLESGRLKALTQAFNGGKDAQGDVPVTSPRPGGDALTRCEWGALAGTLAGVSVGSQAMRTGRSMKTLYAHRYTGLRKLGMSRIDEMLLYSGVAPRGRGECIPAGGRVGSDDQ